MLEKLKKKLPFPSTPFLTAYFCSKECSFFWYGLFQCPFTSVLKLATDLLASGSGPWSPYLLPYYWHTFTLGLDFCGALRVKLYLIDVLRLKLIQGETDCSSKEAVIFLKRLLFLGKAPCASGQRWCLAGGGYGVLHDKSPSAPELYPRAPRCFHQQVGDSTAHVSWKNLRVFHLKLRSCGTQCSWQSYNALCLF